MNRREKSQVSINKQRIKIYANNINIVSKSMMIIFRGLLLLLFPSKELKSIIEENLSINSHLVNMRYRSLRCFLFCFWFFLSKVFYNGGFYEVSYLIFFWLTDFYYEIIIIIFRLTTHRYGIQWLTFHAMTKNIFITFTLWKNLCAFMTS